jgi:hypothetical protein
MSHARKQIRDYTVTLLRNAGLTVFPFRKLPINSLPVIGVYTGSEEINTDEGQFARLQFREVEMNVVGIVSSLSNVEDTMDALCSTIESIIISDPFLGGLAYCVDLTKTSTSIDDSSESEKGIINMTFMVKCLTECGSPEILLKG